MGDLRSYPAVRRALATKVWAVFEPKAIEMLAVLEMRLSGIAASPETLKSIRAQNRVAADRAQKSKGRGGAIAVIPIYGLIMHRQMYDMSGGSAGTSCASISMALQSAIADPNVGSIVLDIDSPGGDVDGVDELATQIFQARKKKPITAVSNCMCASAAYYLASQCSEIVVSPSSLTGSIGVYTMHEDASGMYDQMGIKLELIAYGENKAEGNNLGPLTDTARAHLYEMVENFGVAFEKAVARGRGITQSDVHKKFGQGRVFDAKTAVKLGLADRVGTLDDVLSGPAPAVSSGRSQALAAGPRTAPERERHKTFARMRHELILAGATGISAPKPAKKADIGSDTDCNCDCGPCDDDDNCEGCTCDDCACDGCACETAVAKVKAREATFARMRHEIAVAGA